MLILKDRKMFDENWIYIHIKRQSWCVKTFASWSLRWCPSRKVCSVSNYFCFDTTVFGRRDSDLIELAKRELIRLDWLKKAILWMLRRSPEKAYRLRRRLCAARRKRSSGIGDALSNAPRGGNGMHKYNNQDHAMMRRCSASKTFCRRQALRSLAGHSDAEYHEQGPATAEEANGSALRLFRPRGRCAGSAEA